MSLGRSRVGLAGAATVVLLAAACARPEAPRGGPVPEEPLRVVATVPENLSVVEGFEGPVVLRFPRTLSERTTQGAIQTAVIVSPETSPAEVRRANDALEVSLAEGFAPGVVYRVTVLPRVQDRFQNRLEVAYDLFFSTGGELEPNLLAGFVSDRLTFGPEPTARVSATASDGGVAYQTETDSTGIFSFPYLPSGVYDVVAFRDLNRDGEPGPNEARSELAVTLAPGDTVLTVDDLTLLDPDTTAAVLQNVTAESGGTLRLRMDDYLDPDVPLAGVTTTIAGVDGGTVPVAETLHLYQWEARQPAPGAQPPQPGAQPGQPPGDTLPGGPDAGGQPAGPTPGAQPGAQPGPAGGAGGGGQGDIPPAEGPLPTREFVVILGGTLVGGVDYDVTVDGVVNIHGVPGGGGTVRVTGPDPFAGQ